MSRQSVITVYEGPQFGPAGTDGRFPQILTEIGSNHPIGVSARVRYALDGRENLVFSVPDTPEMRALLAARRVIRLTPPGEITSEWLVSRTTQASGPFGAGMMLVDCDPIRVVMSDAGVVELIKNRLIFANLGGANGTVRNFLATFVIPHLTRRGYGWIEIGQIDSAVQFNLSWDSQTSTQVIEALAKEVGAEWDLRRDEANSRYLIDVVERISGVLSSVEAREGNNILSLVRQRNRERLFTSVRPAGQIAEGDQERGTLGFASWRVTGVSGNNVTVAPHGGGLGAILENGQHVGLFLEAANGTCHQIQGSIESSQTFQLPSGSGASFAVQDDVMIVADNNGTLISSVESPSAVAEFGFAQGGAQSKHFGYRNFMPRSIIQYTNTPVIEHGTFSATATSATQSFSGLPVGFVIATGDLIKQNGSFLAQTVATGGTVDGSGNVTITLSGSISATSGDDAQFFRTSTLALNDWGNAGRLYPTTDGPQLQLGLSWIVNGSITNSSKISLRSLPANLFIPAGTFIFSIPGLRCTVKDATTDGSGNVTLLLNDIVTAADALPFTPHRPIYSTGTKPSGWFDAPSITFTRDIYIKNRALQTVWFTREFLYARFAVASTNPQSGELRVRTLSGTEIAASASTEVDVQVDGVVNGLMHVKTLNAGRLASGTYRFEIVTPAEDTAGTVNAMFRMERCMISLGNAPQPFVEGSEATKIFQDGQISLLLSRQWPATYTTTLSEIVSEWGLDPYSPALALGSLIRLRASSLGVDTILRIVAIEYDPTDPGEKTFTLDSDPERISTIIARTRPPPLFVDVDVEIVDDRGRSTVLVNETPPVVAPGAERFVIRSGSVAPVSNAPLTVQTLPANPSTVL
jgi:hypothetical protein